MTVSTSPPARDQIQRVSAVKLIQAIDQAWAMSLNFRLAYALATVSPLSTFLIHLGNSWQTLCGFWASLDRMFFLAARGSSFHEKKSSPVATTQFFSYMTGLTLMVELRVRARELGSCGVARDII